MHCRILASGTLKCRRRRSGCGGQSRPPPEAARSNADVPIYVINLDRDHERMRLFSETNGHLVEFVRFAAVDGRESDRAALQQGGIIKADLTYNNGQLGCALSHIALWRFA